MIKKTLTTICLVGVFVVASGFLKSCDFNPSKKYTYPDNIKARCEAQKNAAKQCIESKGSPLSEKDLKYIIVHPIKGEKKFTHGWGWREPTLKNIWVLGTCSRATSGGYVINIGRHPDNSADISDAALKHEFGHFWIMHNYNDFTHNNKYSKCFLNWQEPTIRSMSVYTNNSEVIIDYITDEQAKILEVVE